MTATRKASHTRAKKSAKKTVTSPRVAARIPAHVAETLAPLEQAIGYTFSHKELLVQALTHRSFVNEKPDHWTADFERLEFLGDAIVTAIISEELYAAHPDKSEGELTLMRAWLTSDDVLARIATSLQIGDYVFLGAGENTPHGRSRKALLEDVCEALCGAVYLDGGFVAARDTIRALFAPHLAEAHVHKDNLTAKNTLQTRLATRHGITPQYRVVTDDGPAHKKKFCVEVVCGELGTGTGTGTTKKEAEMNAARDALRHLW